MGKLVSMKRTEKEEKELQPAVAGPAGGPKYPWGLKICLDKFSLEKLGIERLPETGTACRITGVGRVVCVTEQSFEKGIRRDVEIQIEKLKLEVEELEAEEAFERGVKKARGRGY